MHNLYSRVEYFIAQHDLIVPQDTLVIGLSGGPDSVFLLHFLTYYKKKFGLKLIAAHLDHGWRQESAEEAVFCKKLAEHLEVDFIAAHAREIALDVRDLKKSEGSQEALGRELRRSFFEQVAKKYGATAIVLGQHQDDLCETFFMRLIRGAGLTGLAALRPREGLYIRPLLSMSKKEILEYLAVHQYAYCIDATNESDKYLRNRIRKYVIPSLRECDTRFNQNCVRSIENLQEAELFLQALTDEYFKKIAHDDTNGTRWLNQELLLGQPAYMQHRLLTLWLCQAGVPFTPTEKFFAEIMRFLQNSSASRHTLGPTWALVRNKNLITIKLFSS